MEIEEGQIWRKEGPHDWIKVEQILIPGRRGYDGGLKGAIVKCYPPQLKGISLRGGTLWFIADSKDHTWQEQIRLNRCLLKPDWKRGDSIKTKKINIVRNINPAWSLNPNGYRELQHYLAESGVVFRKYSWSAKEEYTSNVRALKNSIEFKARRVDTNEWVYGDVSIDTSRGKAYITALYDGHRTYRYQVYPETVRQFTGVKDKYGKKIFHGDKLRMFRHSDDTGKHEVGKVWNDGEYHEDIRTVMFRLGSFYTKGDHGIETTFMHMARPGESYEGINEEQEERK